MVPDTDGDGLNDDVDSCPDKAGPVEFNGCPVPDSDGDGVNDKEDRCPADPGPKNNGGCPLPAVRPEVVRKEVEEKLNFAAKNILFRSGSDELSQSSLASMTEVLEVLESHPQLKMNIEGYTDNSGNAELNKVLSEKRAATV